MVKKRRAIGRTRRAIGRIRRAQDKAATIDSKIIGGKGGKLKT